MTTSAPYVQVCDAYEAASITKAGYQKHTP
jgi:hypothetical protein